MISHLDNAPFWENLRRHGSRPAFINVEGSVISYEELDERVTAAAYPFRGRRRGVGFLYLENDINSFVTLLACLRAGQVPLLLPRTLSESAIVRLQETYCPDWIYGETGTENPERSPTLHWTDVQSPNSHIPSPELGLLLSTSGTTASPKLVRLSRRGLQTNAQSIVSYLGIDPDERALTVLPPSYSYGLSVITSHLLAGASLVVANVSVLSRQFVSVIDEQCVTSISGVPYTYQMLHRTGFGRHGLPSLKVLTQAGGRLDDALVRKFVTLASEREWRFYVMYGQTEATARISYVPFDRLAEKVGSIGVTIPGGSLEVEQSTGELVYRGPNVALGYASTRSDLSRGDDFGGVLRTGDLGRKDDDDFFFITGRKSRFIKVAGNRIGLDEVEQRLQATLGCPISVGGKDDLLIALIESADTEVLLRAREAIASEFRIHHSLCHLRLVAALPLLASGKKDYSQLLSLA